MIFYDADANMGLPPPKYGPNATFMKIDYFSRNTDVLRCRFKNVYETRLKIKNQKTSIKTDKTKVVDLIVLSISRPVALRDHFLNDVL